MKTAFAYWDNRIAPVFDIARQLHIVDTESGQGASETQESLTEALPVQKVLRLVDLGIGTLVCGAISQPMQALVSAYGIRVVPFVAGDLQEVIQAWLGGRLENRVFTMPGCYGRGRRRLGGMQGRYQEVQGMKGRGRGMGAGGGQGQGQGGQRSGRMGGSLTAGPTGYCVCPQCGQRQPHKRGVPCIELKCPQCGSAMTR